MRIALVTNIPNDLILGKRKDAIKCNRKLHYAKIGRKMPSVLGYRFDQLCTNLLTKSRNIPFRNFFSHRPAFEFAAARIEP